MFIVAKCLTCKSFVSKQKDNKKKPYFCKKCNKSYFEWNVRLIEVDLTRRFEPDKEFKVYIKRLQKDYQRIKDFLAKIEKEGQEKPKLEEEKKLENEKVTKELIDLVDLMESKEFWSYFKSWVTNDMVIQFIKMQDIERRKGMIGEVKLILGQQRVLEVYRKNQGLGGTKDETI